ncbi:MAG: 3'-5' exonuclease domain-containing protein 2 [Lautropia mirabilis]|nr:3'-5' exonuclease domain-containing protein 2 [Lautropia mirabilis]
MPGSTPATAHAPERLPRARRGVGPHPLPSPEAVRALPPFERLPDEAIVMVGSELAQQAADEIGVLSVVGFDTESKPVFVRGQAQDGPHLVQFASAERAWLFPLQDPACAQAVAGLLARPELLKVGFGLAGDRAQLLARFGVAPQGLVDLDQTYRALGYRASLGIRMAMAVTFGRYFEKSKSIGTSDWSRQPLSAAQCRYAAHDAWGAFRIYEALCAQGIDVVPPPAVAKGTALRRPRSRPHQQPSPLASARSADRRADAG